MKPIRTLLVSAALAGFLFLVFTKEAHAYLDPGTGSYLLQLLIAGLLGLSLLVKLFWRNIRTWVVGLFSRSEREKQRDAK
jgi:hypothetical protein